MEQFESILVDVDATAAVHPELDRAVSLAHRCGARLTIVDSMITSAHATHRLPVDIDEGVVAGRRHELERLARRVAKIPTTSRLLVGQSATVLIQEVLRSNHDLLVRSHARDLIAASVYGGAVDDELLRKCPCPVLLVGPGRAPERPRIVGVVTGNEGSAADHLGVKVVELTLSMARIEDGAPMLLRTWVPFAEQMIRTNALEDAFVAYVEATRRRMVENLAELTKSFRNGVSHIPTMTRRGKPEDIIPEFTVGQGIDLVVMAAPASDGGIAELFFGGASLKFLRKLTCSLLAVKPDGFVSPVRVPAD
jgi:nucleotide-binding universal stress UspA family protein